MDELLPCRIITVSMKYIIQLRDNECWPHAGKSQTPPTERFSSVFCGILDFLSVSVGHTVWVKLAERLSQVHSRANNAFIKKKKVGAQRGGHSGLEGRGSLGKDVQESFSCSTFKSRLSLPDSKCDQRKTFHSRVQWSAASVTVVLCSRIKERLLVALTTFNLWNLLTCN